MSLFQKSVVNKYLNALDAALINKKYADFQSYFADPVIQENIRNSKEEQFQEGFLRELFVTILGYTLNPQVNFNLTTELKNSANGGKADGAILRETKGACSLGFALAIIELKGTDTTDLDKVETQAFSYKNQHPKCEYVITSNFEKLRFYIQNAVDHLDFDLFRLSKEDFSLLWLCLAKDNLLSDLPLKIKESSVLQEENITKQLYADYSKFREAIYNNLVKNNPETDKVLLFKKTQKLLDRFLFIFFAEDRLLLPPNSISEIVKQWTTLKNELDEYIPLYARFKKYFGYLNTGYKGKKYDIYAYNGGLFKTDEILDAITIDDDILHEHTMQLSKYDFETDVDVNILGHIFEHSLGEIAAIAASEEDIPLYANRRKKDGIFYTPKYITKYIVENTVGKLCEEKRAELNIIDEEYTKGRKNRDKELVKLLDQKLVDYRNWLLGLTILDPACGSGAFLNQALEFLITEHHKIDELRGQLLGGAILFSDISTDILEKNIYGVDLNEESVEIAKLSLWLRTAQKGRKLNTLTNNIKCGNSLIDDPAIGGEKAFNWQKEFPEVFRKKKKKAWHITTATHNSRYSQRMFDNYVKLGEPVWLSSQEELVVTETVAEIVKTDGLNIIEYNVCGDHVHILLVCEAEEVPKIIQKIKSMSARACNIAMGRTTPTTTRGEHAPHTRAAAALPTLEHSPAAAAFAGRGKTQNHLWTQKFGQKQIHTEQQLQNTIGYIHNNRVKHGLAPDENSTVEAHENEKKLHSIIEKITCSREHAFRNEYVGGFDVVIGNPPYVQLQSLGEMSEKLKNCAYETFDKGADLYCLFTERGYKLLNKGGLLSFIMPNKWMLVAYGKSLRKFLAKTGLRQILNFGDVQFFDEATTYVSIFVVQNGELHENVKVLSLNKKNYHGDFLTEVKANIYDYPASRFGEGEWSIQPYNDFCKLEQMKSCTTKLKYLPININYGIKTGFNDAFFIDEKTRQELITSDSKSAEIIKPMIRGRDIVAYGISDFEYLINTHNGIKDKKPAIKPVLINNYSAIKQYLDKFYSKLEKRGDKGDTPYNLRNCAYLEDFDKPKIIYPNMTSAFPFMYDESGLLCNDKSFILTAKNDSISLPFLTAVLNSSLAKLWIWYNCPELQGGTREIRKVYFEHFPVPEADEEQTALLAKSAKERTQLTTDLQKLSSKFQRILLRRFELEALSQKLQAWFSLSFADFVKELGKKKIKLTLTEEAEWEDYFMQEAAKALSIQSEIQKTDNKIDQVVYALYGLNMEENTLLENQAF